MRTVYVLCSVVIIRCLVFIFSFPLDRPMFAGFTAAHFFSVWWLYVAPPFTLGALALLIWKSWMESLSQRSKVIAWAVVGATAGINVLSALKTIAVVAR
jgi:hypothetical protein